jgi:Ser/Thr protein kinase RdoA (MazF antagonist)
MALPDLGDPLGWDQPLDAYADLVRHYARMQIASAGRVPELWAAGCLDRRVDWAVGHGTRWLTDTDLSPWLSADDAAELRRKLPGLPQRAAALAGFGLPDTILHGDMHGGNVMRRTGGYAYIDWTDVAVGHPFVDMINVREREDPAERDTLRDAYLSEWAGFGPAERLRAAWDAAEPLTCLHHAISYGVIVNSMRPPVEEFLVSNTIDWLRRLSRSLDEPAAGPPPVAGRQAGGSPRA